MTDRRLEQIIGNLLRIGVALSAAVVLAGGIWYMASSGMAAPDYRTFRPEPHSIRRLSHPEALMLFGLFILIATPIARVVFSLVAFAMERDRLYVALTAVVLAVLLYSIGTALF